MWSTRTPLGCSTNRPPTSADPLVEDLVGGQPKMRPAIVRPIEQGQGLISRRRWRSVRVIEPDGISLRRDPEPLRRSVFAVRRSRCQRRQAIVCE
ncbi:MAG: hypothetical protein R2710_16435 [Acidimicrobiales bacterium]